MNAFWKVIAYTLITLFLGFILKELGFKGSKLVFLLGTVSLVGLSVIALGEAVSALPKVGEESAEYAKAILKIIGVGYAFGICSDICAELGETSLGGAVTLFGRIEIVLISLPYIRRIVEKGIEIL